MDGGGLDGFYANASLGAASISVVDGLTGTNSEGRLVTIASPTSVDTSLAKWLLLVAFDLPNSTPGSA